MILRKTQTFLKHIFGELKKHHVSLTVHFIQPEKKKCTSTSLEENILCNLKQIFCSYFEQ